MNSVESSQSTNSEPHNFASKRFHLDAQFTKLLIWLALGISPLLLLQSNDPGLIKWPALAFSLSIATLTLSKPKAITTTDYFVFAYFIFSLIHSPYYHDQWATVLATFISILSYSLFRWKSSRIPDSITIAIIWAICIRGIADIYIGTIWGTGTFGTMTSFFVHKNMFAYLLAPMSWYAFWKIRRSQNASNRTIWISSLALTLFVEVSHQSRGALIGAGASILLTGIIFSLKRKSFRLLGITIFSLATFATLHLLIFPDAIPNLKELQSSRRSESKSEKTKFHESTSSEVRAWIWKSTIASWQEHPIIGNGTGTTQYNINLHETAWQYDEKNPETTAWHAHSHYLELLQDKGIFGLIIEFSFVAIALWGYSVSGAGNWAGFGALLALSIHNIVAEASEYPASILLWWGLIGYGIAKSPSKPIAFARQSIIEKAFHYPAPILAAIFSFFAIRPILADYYAHQAEIETNQNKKYEIYQSSLNWWPSNPDVLYALALNQAQNTKYKDALETIKIMDSIAPGIHFTPLVKLKIAILSNDNDQCYKLSHEILSRYPFNRPTQYLFLIHLANTNNCFDFVKFRDSFANQIKSQELPGTLLGSEIYNINITDDKLGNYQLPRWAPISNRRILYNAAKQKFQNKRSELEMFYTQITNMKCATQNNSTESSTTQPTK